MIIDFTVKNFLSIKDETTLSFLASSKDKDKTFQVEDGKYNLYSFNAVYGANASGKSNIIKALKNLADFISYSHKSDLNQPITYYKPFLLDENTRTLPIHYEIEFMTEGVRYHYLLGFDKHRVLKEELNFYPNKKKALLFTRDESQNIKYGIHFTGEKKNIESFILPNKLFLSVCANSANEQLNPVYKLFKDDMRFIDMNSNMKFFNLTTQVLQKNNEQSKGLILPFLALSDLGIKDIVLVEDKYADKKYNHLPEDLKDLFLNVAKHEPYLAHPVFNNGLKTEKTESFNLYKNESTGTIKMYEMAADIIDVITHGNILIIDEFNSGLHPLLTELIIHLFLNKKINKKNAQLFIATHDTAILDMDILDKKQIWFTDKDHTGSTELYSLDEFKIRNNNNFDKLYLQGRFKAIPKIYLSKLEELFNAKEEN